MKRAETATRFFIIVFILVALCACGIMGTKEQETVSYIGSGSKYDELDGIEDDLLTENPFDYYDMETVPYVGSESKYYELDEIGDDLLIEYLFNHYDIKDLLEMRYGHYWVYFKELGIPNVFEVVEELVAHG